MKNMLRKVDLGSFDKFEIEYGSRNVARHDDEEVVVDPDDAEEGECTGKGYDYVVPGNAQPRLHDFDCDSRFIDVQMSRKSDARQCSRKRCCNINVNYFSLIKVQFCRIAELKVLNLTAAPQISLEAEEESKMRVTLQSVSGQGIVHIYIGITVAIYAQLFCQRRPR